MVDENELNVNLKKRKEKKKENGVEKRVSKPKKMRSTCMNKKKRKKEQGRGRNIPWPRVHQAIWGEW